MRHLPALVMAGTLVAISGCGGGGSQDSGGGPAPLTGITGHVVSRDGSTSGLGGIRVDLVETGGAQFTTATGAFAFPMPGGPTCHLKFTDPLAPIPLRTEATGETTDGTGDCGAAGGGQNGATGSGQDVGDIVDGEVSINGTDVSVGVDVEVTIENGVVTGLSLTAEASDGEHENNGEAVLAAVDGSAASGKVDLQQTAAGCELGVEAQGLLAETGFVVVLTDLNGAETKVADFLTNACGEGQAVAQPCIGGIDVQGWRVTVRGLDGKDILVGTVPPMGTDEGQVGPNDGGNSGGNDGGTD